MILGKLWGLSIGTSCAMGGIIWKRGDNDRSSTGKTMQAPCAHLINAATL